MPDFLGRGTMPPVRSGGPIRMGAPVQAKPIASPKPVRAGTAIASLKKGGKIKKTGLYKLHKGEKVVPAKDLGAQALSAPDPDEASPKPKKKKGSGRVPREMRIRKLDDGSFHIRHEHVGKEQITNQPSEEFTAPNAKRLVGHVRDTFSAQ